MLTYDYILDFTAADLSPTCRLRIPGATHGLQTAALALEVSMHTPHGLTPHVYVVWATLDPDTYDIDIGFFSNRLGGVVTLTKR
jgi:hypothetical protein